MIKITKTYYNPNNNSVQYKIGPPKTEKSRRKILVDEMVIDTFKEHMEEQKKVIAHYVNSYTDKNYVFANFYRHPGFPITMKLINDRMKRLLKRAGLNTELSPHSLRHTHTSLLAQADVDLEEIKDRLGHQDDEVTRKIYLHVTNIMKKEASDKFSKLMRGL